MIEESVLLKFKERYRHLHPLLFKRSCERAKNAVELFDILESIPEIYPLSWDEKLRRWSGVEDVCDSTRG